MTTIVIFHDLLQIFIEVKKELRGKAVQFWVLCCAGKRNEPDLFK